MKALLYKSQFGTVHISDEHAACSYGKPVLTIGGTAFGSADVFESGISGRALVDKFLLGKNSGIGRWGKSKAARTYEAFRGVMA